MQCQIKLAKERYKKNNPSYNPDKITCYNCNVELKKYAAKEPRVAYTAYICKTCLNALITKINGVKKGGELGVGGGWSIKHVDAAKGYRYVATKTDYQRSSQWFNDSRSMAAHILMSWRNGRGSNII
jgi:hypothetical protein